MHCIWLLPPHSANTRNCNRNHGWCSLRQTPNGSYRSVGYSDVLGQDVVFGTRCRELYRWLCEGLYCRVTLGMVSCFADVLGPDLNQIYHSCAGWYRFITLPSRTCLLLSCRLTLFSLAPRTFTGLPSLPCLSSLIPFLLLSTTD